MHKAPASQKFQTNRHVSIKEQLAIKQKSYIILKQKPIHFCLKGIQPSPTLCSKQTAARHIKPHRLRRWIILATNPVSTMPWGWCRQQLACKPTLSDIGPRPLCCHEYLKLLFRYQKLLISSIIQRECAIGRKPCPKTTLLWDYKVCCWCRLASFHSACVRLMRKTLPCLGA